MSPIPRNVPDSFPISSKKSEECPRIRSCRSSGCWLPRSGRSRCLPENLGDRSPVSRLRRAPRPSERRPARTKPAARRGGGSTSDGRRDKQSWEAFRVEGRSIDTFRGRLAYAIHCCKGLSVSQPVCIIGISAPLRGVTPETFGNAIMSSPDFAVDVLHRLPRAEAVLHLWRWQGDAPVPQ